MLKMERFPRLPVKLYLDTRQAEILMLEGIYRRGGGRPCHSSLSDIGLYLSANRFLCQSLVRFSNEHGQLQWTLLTNLVEK